MHRSLAWGAVATAAGTSSLPGEVAAATENTLPKPISEYDVVVVGAGTAGTIAAIQSGRLGLRTLLVEKNGIPGGTTTVAAVNFPGLFHAWGRQIIAGIGWELVTNTVSLCGGQLPDFSVPPERHWQHQVRVNRAVYASLACEALDQAGVQALFHAMPAQVVENSDNVSITVCTKSGLETITGRVLIDATGDANAVGLAGCALVAQEERQPGTLILSLDGYDIHAVDGSRLQQAFDAALNSGELTPRESVFIRHNIMNLLRARGDNCTHIAHVDGRTSTGRSAAEVSARVSLLRVYRFLRRQPGLENLEIAFMASECGIRETVTIHGEATITHEDYVSGRLWEDAVCYSFYPIDVHNTDGGGIDTRPLQPGTFPTVPRGALVPHGSRRMLVAGRCLSSDREANSALRVQATCMACGQVAGVLAGRAAREGVSVMAVDMKSVYDDLRAQKAIVPD
jgi:hypothetical protein